MWDPDQYLKFEDYRRRPVLDLLHRVPTVHAAHVVDLGCGPGHLTELIQTRWPDAAITAIDRDAGMIDRARRDHGAPGVDFRQADMAHWEPDHDVDVIFSNAALHWLPDHVELMAGAIGWLAPGGSLAVQVPGNTDAPSHQMLVEQRRSPRWRDLVGAGADTHVAVGQPVDYARRLAGTGVTVDVWETTYMHLLEGRDPVIDWLAGSTLRPVLAVLDTDQRQSFLAELADRLRPHYPPDDAGRTIFAFRRLFMVAHRPR